MNVAMKNGLPSDLTIAHPNIESFNVFVCLFNSSLLLLYKAVTSVELRTTKLEVASYVSLRDHQRV